MGEMENSNTTENRTRDTKDKDKEDKLKEVTRRRLADTIKFNPRILYMLTLPQDKFQHIVNSVIGHVVVWEEQEKEKAKGLYPKNVTNTTDKTTTGASTTTLTNTPTTTTNEQKP